MNPPSNDRYSVAAWPTADRAALPVVRQAISMAKGAVE